MKNHLISAAIISFLLISGAYAYQQAETSVGKVIYGLSRQEALEKFGAPLSIEKNVWAYSSPEEFFVYFPPKPTVTLFPRQMQPSINTPVDFKVLSQLYNTEIEDVTHNVELIADQPEAFTKDKSGNLLSEKPGNYIILARYAGSLSNPCYFTIPALPAGGKPQEETGEKLLNLDILPFKPQLAAGDGVNFVILATFLDPAKNKYSVRNIERGFELSVENAGDAASVNNKRIKFSSPGKFNAYCRYGGIESYRQECSITPQSEDLGHGLKHIAVLPNFMQVPVGTKVQLKAYGSFYDNHVEDITGLVAWNIDKKNLVSQTSFEEFLAESAGIAQVYAEKNGIKSLPVKIVISAAPTDTSRTPAMALRKEEKKEVAKESPAEKIKKNAEKLSGAFSSKEKKPSSIAIEPDHLQLAVGEEGKFQASLIYSDGSRQDITLLSEWVSSDTKVAVVNAGKVNALSEGGSEVKVKYKTLVSAPARVVVGPARLVSIAVSPQEASISMKEKVSLKAEGYYSDSSHRDITDLVSWRSHTPWIARVNRKGEVSGRWLGTARISAEYSGVSSLPVNIRIIFTIGWLLEQLLKFVLVTLLVLAMIFVVFFIFTEKEKKKLTRLFYSDHGKFTIGLYLNLCRILALFGFHNRNHLPPLSFAAVIESAYNIKENAFLKLTVKFEEAKYSDHAIGKEDSLVMLGCYNALLDGLHKNSGNLLFLYRYGAGLLNRIPFMKLKV